MRLSEIMIPSMPLESILKEFTIPEMAAGDEKQITQEEWDEAIKLMNDHNSRVDPNIKGFYYIDVTGRWEVYFTLWRWKDIDPRVAMWIKNPIYMGNMTTNFITSVKKALDKIPKSVRFQIMTEQNREGLIGKNSSKNNETIKFTFGKYRGKVKNHKEYLGIKFTQLNYVKPLPGKPNPQAQQPSHPEAPAAVQPPQ